MHSGTSSEIATSSLSCTTTGSIYQHQSSLCNPMDEPSQNSILPIKADCSDLWIFRGLIPKQDKFIFNDGVGLSSLKKTFLCVIRVILLNKFRYWCKHVWRLFAIKLVPHAGPERLDQHLWHHPCTLQGTNNI